MLELKDLTFTVEENGKEKVIIDNLSYTVEDNKFTVITGPNGGGKSTLAKLIAGIEIPTSGKIVYNGQDITHMSITDRANMGISYAFQQPVRFKGIKVIDLIRLASGENLSVAGACEYLSEVGLCARDYINRDVDGSLSGGELKRIEIAGVIARKTPLSVFDEPEAGIDLWSFHNLTKVFENMQAKKENTIIIISHQERILKIADEIVILADGKVRESGSRDEMLPKVLGTTEGCRFYQ
ncbi:MAG TPA: ATP-binding cassette domain-containing protein [Candidatus Eubacterium faecigallinarum]|nr:ATP-binding cassette domain-containing protein [Candidatus Eubacterium faecigallinarum]